MKKYISIVAVSLLSPLIAFAALDKTSDLIIAVGKLISQLITIAGGVALLVFLWGLARFIFKSGDEKSHEEGIALMKWGIIALFVMVSVWGIIGFMQSALGLPRTVVTPPVGTPVGTPLPCGQNCPQFIPGGAV